MIYIIDNIFRVIIIIIKQMNRLPHQHLAYHFYTGVELFENIVIAYDKTEEYSF